MRSNNVLAGSILLLPVVALACGGADSDAGEADDAAPAETIEAATLEPATTDPAGAVTDGNSLLNPNDASGEELVAVEGMTDDAAAALMGARPFASMADVHAALSVAIGEEAALATYASVWLPISLNDAGRDEILLIPGVGDRMAHEFEEYRPYSDMDQFRREIGKYVDEEEVARLERYVTLN